MADSLRAKAFTLGNDIAFGANQYSANTHAGQNLLGHELAHVIQQRGLNGKPQAKWIQCNGQDWRDSLSWLQRRALELDDWIQESPVAKGIVNNLDKRGQALVNAPAAIIKKYEEEGLVGIGISVVEGAVHLVEDTLDAAADVGHYAAQAYYEGDAEAKEKVASRSLDIVLNLADIAMLVDGAGAAKNATVGGAKAVVKGGRNVAATFQDLASGGRLVTAEGIVLSGNNALALTADAGKLTTMATEAFEATTVFALATRHAKGNSTSEFQVKHGETGSPTGKNVRSNRSNGNDRSGSSKSTSFSETNSSHIPEEYFVEAIESIDQGKLQASGAHLNDLTNHAQSRAARTERGITGQSTHISARSAMKGVATYDPKAALTRILSEKTHRGFDDYWKHEFRKMANSGGNKITVRDYFNTMCDAIRNNRYFSPLEANSMVELLRDELYVQHGLKDSDLLRLPYSK
jgi:hypothetical protein